MGRNLELKRKDWLHEEARGKTSDVLDNIIRSVESALDWRDRIQEAEHERERSLGYGYISDDNMVVNLGLDDYAKFLTELKRSLIEYGKQNNNPEILARADKFLAEGGDVVTDLNTILLFLKGEQS